MDRVVWESTYRNEYSEVYRALVAIGARHPDAEDALQEAFLKGLDAEEVRNPRSWLFVVANRICRRRQMRDRIFRPLDAARANVGPSVEGDGAGLLTELNDLPKRQREVLVLRYVLDLTQEETATALGIARGTVGACTSQGLAALRLRLGGRR